MSNATLPADQLRIIRHSLGLAQADVPYRNSYCAPDAGPIRETLESMADAGLMRRGVADLGGVRFFHVTPAGAAAAGVELPR